MPIPHALSPEILVNTTTVGSQAHADIAKLPNGGFVVIWQEPLHNSTYKVMARICRADGQVTGNEFLIETVRQGGPDETNARVQALSDGKFVVTWHTPPTAVAQNPDVFAQVFNADGSAFGNRLQVTTYAGFDYASSVTPLTNGAFAVTWSRDLGNGNVDVFGRIYAANGLAGAEFQLNTIAGEQQYITALTTLSNGQFVAAWEDNRQNVSVIRGQIFNADGSKSGAELLLSRSAMESARMLQQDASIAGLKNGNFVVTYVDKYGSGNAYAQVFNHSGANIGSEFQVNGPAASSGAQPNVTALDNGGFVITWTTHSPSSDNDVYAQRFNADGTKVGDEFLVHASVAGDQRMPNVTVLSSGNIVVGWSGKGPGDDAGVFVRLFSANTLAPDAMPGQGGDFVEGNGPVAVAPQLTLADPDSSSLKQAIVQINSGLNNAQDQLFFTPRLNFGDIESVYYFATGTLVLRSPSGDASLAQWQAALRAVSYDNSSQNPSTAPRTISFTLSDAQGAGMTTHTQVGVEAVNDAPELTVSAGHARFVEGNNTPSTPVAVDPSILLQDVDSSTFGQATVRITIGLQSTEDLLQLQGSFGNIQASYDVNTGTLTLTSANATATLALWQAALRAVQYSNISETPDASDRVIQFIIQDSAGASSATATRTVTVAAVNDTPLVAAALEDQSVDQDSPFLFAVPASSFTDADGDTLTYSAKLANGDPLPAWLSFNPLSRSFTGTPSNSDVGLLHVTVTVDDGQGGLVSSTFGLTIHNINDAPTLAQPLADQGATQDAAFSFSVPAGTFADIDVGDTLSYTAARADGRPLPGWLVFDAATGVFSGRPGNSDVGTLNIRLTATDRGGLSVSDEFTITVANVNDAPVLRNLPAEIQKVTVGVAAALPAITVWDPDGSDAPLTLTLTASHASLDGAPDADPTLPGLQLFGTAAQINAALAKMSFTPWAAGSSGLGFSLSDGLAPVPTTGSLALSAAPSPGTSAIDWVSYAGSRADYVLAQDSHGVWSARPTAGGPATLLTGIERVRFEDGTVALDLKAGDSAEQASRLVFSLWGQAGLENPALIGQAIAYVDALGAAAFGQSAQALGLLAALAGGSEPEALLTLLHTNLVGRAPDAFELKALRDFQEAGGHSPAELLAIVAGLPQVGQALAPLSSSGLALTPFAGVLQGSDRDEVFRAQQGNDHIDAGGGLDKVMYGGQAAQYALARDAAGHWVVHSDAQDGGRDLLQGVERLQFADQAVALDLDGAAGQALRLLAAAVGPQKLADRALLGEVIAYVDAYGAQSLADEVQANGLLDALAGGDSLQALVTLLYRNLTGHAPNQEELQWTLALAEQQYWDRADVLLQVAQLPQTAELIGLDVLASQGVAYDSWMG